MHYQLIIIGGGAAGYFCAANLDVKLNTRIAILEKGRESLAKVRVSGGGRCNVTHACFQNSKLLKNYPRGSTFLKKGFAEFSCEDTVKWFERRGVQTKTESDGRMFPASNSSQSIIDCLQNNISASVEYKHATDVVSIFVREDSAEHRFSIQTKDGDALTCDQLVVATGSNVRVWKILEKLGHSIIKPVPSLFTFHIDDERIKDLQGLSVPKASVRISGEKIVNEGPLLITHWGQSGPAILKLSAFGARVLAEKEYQFELEVNWVGRKQKIVAKELNDIIDEHHGKVILRNAQFGIPSRLWERLCGAANLQEHMRYKDLNEKNKLKLLSQLCAARFKVTKKSTFKEEFVTAGGVDTIEVDPLTFESKKIANLYLAGEILNVDAVTGGFNFQAAWTGGYLIAQALNAALDAE